MRKIIRGADEASEKKLRTALGHGEKPVIKVVGCKTDTPSEKKATIRKKKPRKRLTMREQTILWTTALQKAGKLQDKPIIEPYDYWSLPVPDYDQPVVGAPFHAEKPERFVMETKWGL